MGIIKLGTRSSKLALWQANAVKQMLENEGLIVEIVLIETKGDKILDRALSKIGSKGLFTEELEEQLFAGEIDLVQHSAKDLQAQLPDGLEIIAFTEREKANDVVVSLNKDFRLKNDANCIVGTSSTRRVAMLKHLYPKITTVDMRGNLQTRFKKLAEGQAQAMLLAYAGVHRMAYDQNIVDILDLQNFTSAVGQGSIALEIATKLDPTVKEKIRKACNHNATETCILAERAFLRAMQGGCSIPVFGYATLKNGVIELEGGIVSLNGRHQVRHKLEGKNPYLLGETLGKTILKTGGKEILDEIRANIQS